MAGTLGSNNEFPSVLVKEGTAPSAPAAGDQRLYIDSADHKLKRINSSSAVTIIENATPTFVGCSVYNNTTQTPNTATETAAAMNAENYDTDSFHDNVTANTKITIPTGKGGKYDFKGFVYFAAAATGDRYAFFRKNGTDGLPPVVRIPTSSGSVGTGILVAGTYVLVAGDYLEFMIYQASGSGLVSGSASFAQLQNSIMATLLGS